MGDRGGEGARGQPIDEEVAGPAHLTGGGRRVELAERWGTEAIGDGSKSVGFVLA